MKKIFFIAIYGALFCFLSCTKKEKSDPSPVTVTEQNASDGTTLETIPEAGDGIMLRSCTGCTTCCCTVTVTAPLATPVGVDFCSSVFPPCGFPGCGCTIGDGVTCLPGTPTGSNFQNATLEEGVPDGDYKVWCGGDNTVPFVIRNTYGGGAVTYRVDCGGPNGAQSYTVPAFGSLIVRKDVNCDVTDYCYY